MLTSRRFALFVVPAAILLLAGCGKLPTADPKIVAEHRARLTLAEEPAGAQPVNAVRNALFGVTAEEHVDEHSDHDHAQHADEHEKHDDHAEKQEDDPKSDAARHDDEHEKEHEAGHEEEHEHDHATDPTVGKTPVVSEMDVVLTGLVGGLPNPSEQSHPDYPFAKGKAVIFVADPEAVAELEEHAHHHAPGEECAFCAAHAAESARSLAVVQFTDAAGKPIPVDARDLFGLKEKQEVVIRGKAKVDPSGVLTVAANGLYIRK